MKIVWQSVKNKKVKPKQSEYLNNFAYVTVPCNIYKIKRKVKSLAKVLILKFNFLLDIKLKNENIALNSKFVTLYIKMFKKYSKICSFNLTNIRKNFKVVRKST